MELQITQDGLFRTLLYQLVSQHPDILPEIAPKHWESLCLFNHPVSHWPLQDLQETFFRAVKGLGNNPSFPKICVFIDGLDEFGGEHEDLVLMVRTLIETRVRVKVCVASRPWNLFQTAVGQDPNLRLEDLTFNDIKIFVRSKLNADIEFINLRHRYPEFADQLTDNIVVKACGVFLWVDLDVASLLAGLRMGDRIEDFQRRLDELPPELEKLYEKILQSLDSFYLPHAAQYFALVESAGTPLTILQFAFADEESSESALMIRPGSISQSEILLRIESFARRLSSRCKGFVKTGRALQGANTEENRNRSSDITVQYLHRTVRDFIKSPKAQTFLQSSTNPDFDASIQLVVAFLMDLKA